ncbi:MAG: hypothetical protein U0Y10_25025 [Spirosomataceae bacterium]
MDFLKLAKSIFLPNDSGKTHASQSNLSNNQIVSLLTDSFKTTIQKESITGHKLLYDTSYLILMHPDDYKDRELALGVVTQVAVNVFYEIIEKQKPLYKDYVPMGNYWHFQYSPCAHFQEIEIKPGHPLVMSTLTTTKTWNQLTQQSLRVSRIANHSRYEKYDINPAIFRNLDVVDKGIFKIKFNPELSQLTAPPKANQSGFAQLSYTLGSMQYTYVMMDAEIKVTLKTDSTIAGSHILAIDVPNQGLAKEHALIRYDEVGRSFQIAAYANTLVNEKNIPLSIKGETPQWEALSPQSSIMLGWFNLKFESLL